ncbi:sulfurtransferase [Corynebacterium hindlerae]|uniref:sulfurtransferase n=1 Tax=Corynebacterium hindlerae TaxID=699041 RepID=UPI003AAAC943
MAVPLDPNPKFSEYAHPERLVSPQWLSAQLGSKGLKVVESDEDALLYNIGHIPGAVRIDWHKDLNDPLTRDFISPEAFAALMDEKGIAHDDTVVIYGDKHNWWAAYTFWIFEMYGHPDVRLLDGGRDAWMSEERDTSYDVPNYPASRYPVPTASESALRAFVGDVQAAVDKGALIDARTPAEYRGEESWLSHTAIRLGHIPSALNIPCDGNVMANNFFRSRKELDAMYSELDPSAQTIVYCHEGERSSHSWFTLKYLLGFENVLNYDGAWVEWGNMVRMPIAKDS